MFFQLISHTVNLLLHKIRLNCRIPGPLIYIHWITIVSIVIFLVLQRHRHLGRVFCNRSQNSSPTNLISQKFSDSAVILAISVSKRCTLDLSVVKAQGSIAGFLFFLPFCHSKKIFTDHFVTARVDFGIAFSILKIPLFLGIFRLPKSSETGRHVLFGQ